MSHNANYQAALCIGGSTTAAVSGMCSFLFAQAPIEGSNTASKVALVVAMGGLLTPLLTNANVALKNYLDSKEERHKLKNLLNIAMLRVEFLEEKVRENRRMIGLMDQTPCNMHPDPKGEARKAMKAADEEDRQADIAKLRNSSDV